MSEVCRAFGISRKTGYKIFERYKEHGLEALTDRSRRHHLISLLDHGRRHARGDTLAPMKAVRRGLDAGVRTIGPPRTTSTRMA
jgi:Helix-turn-helix domain